MEEEGDVETFQRRNGVGRNAAARFLGTRLAATNMGSEVCDHTMSLDYLSK